MLIISGSPSVKLARRVAKTLGVRYVRTELNKFPDGEKYARIVNGVKDEEIVIVQSTAHKPDEYLFEFFLLADAARDLGARKLIAVFPYFAYARQDERFKPGEAISFLTVSKLIQSVGVNQVYTIDSHRHRIADFSKVFRIPIRDLTAMPLLVRYVKRNVKIVEPIVIGPDAESEPWVRTVAEELDTEFDVMEKKRIGPKTVRITPGSVDAKGRDVLLADDIISTGGTIVEATKVLRRQGAKKIVVVCTHPILTGNALVKIRAVGVEKVIGTDTVQSPVSFVSVSPVIADAVSAKAA